MARSSFSWDFDEVFPKIKGSPDKAKAYVSKITNYHAMRSMAAMRKNAPWTDRTGNARQGLMAFADNSRASSGHWEIVLGHSVSYGIFLELKQPSNGVGKYAVVLPTVQSESQEYFKTISKMLRSMF